MKTCSLDRLGLSSGRAVRPLLRIMIPLFAILVGGLRPLANAAEPSFPSTFKEQTIATQDGAKIFVRSGGAGPAAILIHGYGDTGDMWAPLAVELAKTHTVIVPDL